MKTPHTDDAIRAVPSVQDIADRARRIAAQSFPGVPFQVTCSWVYHNTLDDGQHEYKCSQCHDTQVVSELLGATETRECRGI